MLIRRPVAPGAIAVLLGALLFAVGAAWSTITRGPTAFALMNASVAVQLVVFFANWPVFTRLARMRVPQALCERAELPAGWSITLLLAQLVFFVAMFV